MTTPTIGMSWGHDMAGWQLKKITLPAAARKALEDNQKGIATPFTFSIRGQAIGIHNWTHGRRENSNKYLSPANAVSALAEKLTDAADVNRPKDDRDCVVLMVTSYNIGGFVEQLKQVSAILPDKTIKQALDYAEASKDLAQTKMIKTPRLASPCFSAPTDITPGPGRELNAVMRNAQSANQQPGDPFEALAALKQRKADKAKKNTQKLTALLNAQAQIYALTARATLDEVALNLSANLPGDGNAFTVLLCYIGEDLSLLRGMLNEPN